MLISFYLFSHVVKLGIELEIRNLRCRREARQLAVVELGLRAFGRARDEHLAHTNRGEHLAQARQDRIA